MSNLSFTVKGRDNKIVPIGTPETLDRFRNLPGRIAHQILRFISMEELARFRLVSKRCKRWCFTISHLTFDNRTHGPIDSDRQIQQNFVS
ncbi:hypothetical protein SADUNF_Sadunf09G0083300 [Salix dunnii]|uniref:F-box domain-containing protein n=1 Tax=Salix dunnii TaxID=1413687 RepID=A0A835JXS4_9ROSI|nr:hypothetical protein SADUNF_Sadunf09G0083300 [Salix dunnii]